MSITVPPLALAGSDVLMEVSVNLLELADTGLDGAGWWLQGLGA